MHNVFTGPVYSGDYANALIYFENGSTSQVCPLCIIIIIKHSHCKKDKEHNETCNGGIARMAIRTGDIRRYSAQCVSLY